MVAQRARDERGRLDRAKAGLLAQERASRARLDQAKCAHEAWRSAREEAVRRQQERAAYFRTRNLTDPVVSVSERLRARCVEKVPPTSPPTSSFLPAMLLMIDVKAG